MQGRALSTLFSLFHEKSCILPTKVINAKFATEITDSLGCCTPTHPSRAMPLIITIIFTVSDHQQFLTIGAHHSSTFLIHHNIERKLNRHLLSLRRLCLCLFVEKNEISLSLLHEDMIPYCLAVR